MLVLYFVSCISAMSMSAFLRHSLSSAHLVDSPSAFQCNTLSFSLRIPLKGWLVSTASSSVEVVDGAGAGGAGSGHYFYGMPRISLSYEAGFVKAVFARVTLHGPDIAFDVFFAQLAFCAQTRGRPLAKHVCRASRNR